MKLNFVVFLGLVCLVALASARPAEEDYAEYDEEPAPPPKKTPARTPLIGRRNPLAGRNAKPSTTAAPAPAAEDEEEEAADEELGEDQPEQTSSTTEAPKKFIKAGMVRPFRSNDDLLATLKRRREQAAQNKHSKGAHAAEAEEADAGAGQNEPAPKPARASATAGRRRFNGAKSGEPAAAAASEDAPATAAPARTGRRFSARS